MNKLKNKIWPLFSLLILFQVTSCNNNSKDFYDISMISNGVVFTYPMNNQHDVPTSTRFIIKFSQSVNEEKLMEPVSLSESGEINGNFYLIGDEGIISLNLSVAGDSDEIIEFEADNLKQGSKYRLYAKKALLNSSSNNLSDIDPLITFSTRQYTPITGQAPSVISINGEDADLFLNGNSSIFPFLDFTTIRIEFSEPLNESTVRINNNFRLVSVDPSNGTETNVKGDLLVKSRYSIFDPQTDLTPDITYRLYLTDSIKDLNGDSIKNYIFEFVPKKSKAKNDIIQKLNTRYAIDEQVSPVKSLLTNRSINSLEMASSLIGVKQIGIVDSTLEGVLGNPSKFNGTIPLVIRKGNCLTINGLDVSLRDEIPLNLSTGNLQAHIISDAAGFLFRNPHRSSSVFPDEDKSPVYVYLTLDLALTGKNAMGNAVLNQTLYNVQATGIALVDGGKNLYIEVVTTLELDLLGVHIMPAHLVLGISTDSTAIQIEDIDPPWLVTSYPSDGDDRFLVSDSLQLIFTEPVESTGLTPQKDIELIDITDGIQVPFQFEFNGSTLLINPDSNLEYGHQYEINILSLTDKSNNKNPLALTLEDATGGDGIIEFTIPSYSSSDQSPMMIAGMYPGVPCTLSGTTIELPGSCTYGLPSDEDYLPFEIAADQSIFVKFTQPVDPSTLILGTNCGEGTVRVELVDSGGVCLNPVTGSLLKMERGIKFIPDNPWQEGLNYHLTIVSNEVLGINGMALNGDILEGNMIVNEGGADIEIWFTGAVKTTDTLLTLNSYPYSDINGNGLLDTKETARPENSALVNITGVTPIITSAVINGNPYTYLSTILPVSIGSAEPLTLDTSPWGITASGSTQIPARINPGIIYGTSLTIDAVALYIIPITNIMTRQIMLRVQESDSEPVTGYIIQADGEEQAQFVARLNLYMDAPDMLILAGNVSHDLKSKPIEAFLKGPVSFLEDGRISISATTVTDINITINLTFSTIGLGSLTLQIPAGELNLNLTGELLKGLEK